MVSFDQLCFGERMQLQKLIYVPAGKDPDEDYECRTSVPQTLGSNPMSVNFNLINQANQRLPLLLLQGTLLSASFTPFDY